MLQWNELRLSPDGRYLIIDVEVQHMDYYEDVYIKTLYFTTYKNSADYDPIKDKGIKICLWRDFDEPTIEGENYQEVGQEGEHYRHLRKVVDLDVAGSDKLFFVTATNSDDFAPDTPCGCKDTSLLGVVYNKALLYNNSIKMLGSLNGCTPNKELIDFILNKEAFKIALETGDYKAAIEYWNGTFKKQIVVKSSCCCHGH